MSQQSIQSNNSVIQKYVTERNTLNHQIRDSRLNLTPNVNVNNENKDDDQCIQGTTVNKSEEQQKLISYISWSDQSKKSNKKSLADEMKEVIDKINNSNQNNDKSIPSCIRVIFDLIRLKEQSKDLYQKFIHFPNTLILLLDQACNEFLYKYKPNQKEQTIIKTFPHNMPTEQHQKIRNLSVQQISNLISIKGLVLRVSEIIPLMVVGKFVCSYCEDITTCNLTEGLITEPKQCSQCKSTDTQALKHNGSLQDDSQYIKIQEDPDDLPQGETAQNVLVQVMKDNVDIVKPGDRIDLIGIYTVDSRRMNSRDRKTMTAMKSYISVISFTKIDRSKSKNITMNEDGLEQFTENQVEEFKEFADRQDLQNVLTKSFAPSIFESDSIKFGLLTQLFGGVEKKVSESKSEIMAKRGEINVLLLGDPSTGKSQLLKYVNKIAPRGVYTSGKGSSAVGLTAHVASDPETGELVLESGALVLSDRGICCIDEFDKMSMSGRSVLHEVMEQQTISIAKAGIICNLNARTAVLAAANPIESKYNKYLSVVKNINLPPSLISRFDLIQIVLDDIDEEKDKKMADHILELFENVDLEDDQDDENKNGISDRVTSDFMKNQILYARLTCRPKLISESYELLVNKQVEMRRYGNTTRTISATPRQLESLVRLSESIAKMRLSNVVTQRDVEMAYDLFQQATKQSMTDPKTGIIDMNQFSGGLTFEDNQLMADVAVSLNNQFQSFKINMREGIEVRKVIDDIVREFRDQKGIVLAQRVVLVVLENLHDEGKVLLSGNHLNKIVKIIDN